MIGGRTKFFKLTIDPSKYGSDFSDLPLSFALIPYDGDPNLYIHAGSSRPQYLSDYEYSSEEPYEERIIVSAEERK